MKAIEQTSLMLLAISLLIVAAVAAGLAFESRTAPGPLDTGAPELKDFSYLKSLQEATSLETVKKMCRFWAEREDQSRRAVSALYTEYRAVMTQLAIGATMLAAIFAAGLFYIYLTARRLHRIQRGTHV